MSLQAPHAALRIFDVRLYEQAGLQPGPYNIVVRLLRQPPNSGFFAMTKKSL